MKIVTSILVLGLSALSFSCLDNLKQDPEDFEYSPEFSVPIGPLSYSLDDIMPPVSLNTYYIPDTSLLDDTINEPLIIYNDSLFFYNPEKNFDTTIYETISLTTLIENSENVVSAMFRMNITNSIPTALDLQIYFRDVQGDLLDSLFQEGRIRVDCPEINSEGYIVEPVHSTLDSYFEAEEMDELIPATQMEIFIFLHTYTENNDYLRVYSWNKLDLQLGIRAHLELPIMP